MLNSGITRNPMWGSPEGITSIFLVTFCHSTESSKSQKPMNVTHPMAMVNVPQPGSIFPQSSDIAFFNWYDPTSWGKMPPSHVLLHLQAHLGFVRAFAQISRSEHVRKESANLKDFSLVSLLRAVTGAKFYPTR